MIENSKKNRVKRAAVLLMAITMLASSMGVFAQSYSNKYVYGSKYTVVADGKNDNNGANFVTVTLSDIYKDDGSESNYSRVRADVLNGSGNQISTNTNVAVDLNKTTTIMLNQTYASGAAMKLRMKGNDSSKDCIVTFAASISTN